MSGENGAPKALWALVTGASSGIGVALARELRRRGERVILVARRRPQLESLARELGGSDSALALPVDLADPEGPGRLQADIDTRGLLVDTLVNNAGFGDTGPFAEQDLARIRGMVDLNVRAVVELARRFLPGMVDRRRGRILNVASTAAFQPVPFLNVYAATKSFVLSFSEGLSVELEGTGVTVSALCPGFTDTEFFEKARTGEALLAPRMPRMTPEAVARAALDGLEGRRSVAVAGFTNRLMIAAGHFVPRSLTARVAARLYREPRASR